MKETLSVVIPVYNSESYIEETILSVLNQRQDVFDIEVVAVDDCSSDQTYSKLQMLTDEHHNVCVVRLPENKGVAAARNAGVAHASGKWLSFVDHDDCWVPQKIALQYQYLENHPDLDFVLCHLNMYVVEGKRKPSWVKEKWLDAPQSAYEFGAILIRKENFLRVGKLNEDFRHGMDDVQWFVHARQLGLKHHVMDDVLYSKKLHETNLSSQTKNANTNMLKLIREKIKKEKSHA